MVIATLPRAVLVAAVLSVPTDTLFSWPSLVYGECPPVDLLAVQDGYSCLGLLITAHLDKAETFRVACVPIHDDLSRLDRSVRLEQGLQIAVGHVIRQVAD